MQDVQKIIVWHNPRCGKSRDSLKVLDANNTPYEVVKYLDNVPSIDELKNTLSMLGIPPRELMRTTEAIYKELGLKEESDDEKLIQAMVENPKLIQRPILFKNGKAIIGRPTEIIEEFLKS